MAAGACTTSRHIFGAANPFFSVLIISQAGKWAISPLPLPLFVAHLLGRNGRGKGKAEEEEGGGGSFDQSGFVSVLHLPRSWPAFILDRACNGRDKSSCVFVGGCGQRERERLVLRSFSEDVCSRDGNGLSSPGTKGWCPCEGLGWAKEGCGVGWGGPPQRDGQCHSSGGECPKG